MEYTWDENKRRATLAQRGLDFADAAVVFAGTTRTLADDRQDYGEARFQTFGHLNKRLVVLVWTLRQERRRIISMRVCNEREQRRYLDLD